MSILADPDTSIAFPTTIRIPSKLKIPPMTLVGLGVRSVSFLGIKVYSVGFYADLENPNLKVSHRPSHSGAIFIDYGHVHRYPKV